MALTEIISDYTDAGELSFARGGGTVTEITSQYYNTFQIPAGAGVGAVFPAEGDVDYGVNYGPTGADYTGTITQPDPVNVLAGVQYGADGTEYTGLLTGGAGFISIINE